MQTDDTRRAFRSLGSVAMLAAGLVLGAAVPALAEVGEVDSSELVTACSPIETVSTGESEWAVPPMPGRPGEPY